MSVFVSCSVPTTTSVSFLALLSGMTAQFVFIVTASVNELPGLSFDAAECAFKCFLISVHS